MYPKLRFTLKYTRSRIWFENSLGIEFDSKMHSELKSSRQCTQNGVHLENVPKTEFDLKMDLKMYLKLSSRRKCTQNWVRFENALKTEFGFKMNSKLSSSRNCTQTCFRVDNTLKNWVRIEIVLRIEFNLNVNVDFLSLLPSSCRTFTDKFYHIQNSFYKLNELILKIFIQPDRIHKKFNCTDIRNYISIGFLSCSSLNFTLILFNA